MSRAEIEGPKPPDPRAVRQAMVAEGVKTMNRAVLLVEHEVKRRMERSRRTGTSMRSVTHRVSVDGGRVIGWVGSNYDVVRWLNDGTGLYGPAHRWIVPKRAKALRFPEPGNRGFTLMGRQRSGRAGAGARFVYAKRVRGVRPRRYFQDAGLVMQPKVVSLFAASGAALALRIGSLGGRRG